MIVFYQTQNNMVKQNRLVFYINAKNWCLKTKASHNKNVSVNKTGYVINSLHTSRRNNKLQKTNKVHKDQRSVERLIFMLSIRISFRSFLFIRSKLYISKLVSAKDVKLGLQYTLDLDL